MLDERTKRFVRKLEGKPPPACILGPGGPHTLGYIRSLGKRGIPVILAGIEQRATLGSRYAFEARQVHGESSLLAFLAALGEHLPHKAVMLPTADAEVLFMARNRRQLARYYSFALPDTPVLETLANKKTQYEFAADSGVPIPKTFYPQNHQDIAGIADKVEYPCIIKPAYSHVWRNYRSRVHIKGWEKLAEVSSPKELRDGYHRMAAAGVELLVQERIPGADSRLYSLYTYFNRHAQPLATIVIRKERQWPPLYGSGSSSVTCKNEDVAALGLKLLRKAKYHGPANIEFKLDPRDGKYKLIEINVRSGERLQLAVDSGVDIAFIAYADLLGNEVAPVDIFRDGRQWMNFINDFGAFLYYRNTGAVSFGQWAGWVMASRSRAYFSWDDPVPFLLHVKQVATKAKSYASLLGR